MCVHSLLTQAAQGVHSRDLVKLFADVGLSGGQEGLRCIGDASVFRLTRTW